LNLEKAIHSRIPMTTLRKQVWRIVIYWVP